MKGKLNETQINNILLSQIIGRLGYTDGNKTYITPVTFVYDGKYIIGQTNDGMKLEAMRKNPNVCFEVDLISNLSSWQSVLLFGKFQELKGTEEINTREYLFDHVLPLITNSRVHAHEHEVECTVEDDRVKTVMYRIKIYEKTGRFADI